MKTLFVTLLLTVISTIGFAQTPTQTLAIESYKRQLAVTKHDTSRVLYLNAKIGLYQFTNPDSALILGEQALVLSRKIKFRKGESGALSSLGFTYMLLANFSKGLEVSLKALKIAEDDNLTSEMGNALQTIANIYHYSKDHSKYPTAILYYHKAAKLYDVLHDYGMLIACQESLGLHYLDMNNLDSSSYYLQLANKNTIRFNINWPKSFILADLGIFHAKNGNNRLALDYFNQSLVQSKYESVFAYKTVTYLSIATTYQQMNMPDSSIYFARKSLEEAQKTKFYSNVIYASSLLADLYKKKDSQEAIHFYEITIAAKDSLYNIGKTNSLNNLTAFDAQERQYELDIAKATYQNQIRQYSLLGGLGVFLIIAFILYRNNQKEKQAKRLLQEQKDKVEDSLSKLKASQTQLIQSEKMASLGELTAGIAHEIQNPLNFVNNFSEVNKELLSEMKEEIEKGNLEDVKSIAETLIDNQEKITHHGKRADAIVKGMLQHSRSSSGVHEPTDINALADEYLGLAYHGLRAKDKSFGATMKTEFDEAIGNINIIPQDIGRVILNLITNAFYAVHEKSKQSLGNYEPAISVSTKKDGNKVLVTVKDNGNGIPKKILEKIFQPFFTTKPTGQGTGLGLSLSYDIVKAHGGEIIVESEEGKGTQFTIQIPLS